MASTAFSGPLLVGKRDNSTAWPLVAAATLALAPAAALTTDFSLAVPKGRILRITTGTNTAFTGNTVTVQVGTTLGGAEIVAAASIKAAGTVAHTLVAAAQNNTIAADTVLYVRITQTATATAVGAAVMTIEFVPLA